METQPTEDYIIPDEDSIFSLLPDGREVTFPDLGGLRNHVQEEIGGYRGYRVRHGCHSRLPQ